MKWNEDGCPSEQENRVYLKRGISLYKKKRFNEALAQWRLVLVSVPDHPKALKYIGIVETFLAERSVRATAEKPLSRVRQTDLRSGCDDSSETPHDEADTKENDMSNVDLSKLSEIDGFEGASLVDSTSGMTLGMLGGGSVDLEVAAAGNTQVVRAKLETIEQLNLGDEIEDMLISLERAYHIIRPLAANKEWFLYLVLDRKKANLGMARHLLKTFDSNLFID